MEIYHHLLQTLSVGLFFTGLFVFEPYNRFVDRYLNFKPFNCVLCLSLWGSMLIFFLMGREPMYAIISAMVAELTYRQLTE